MRNVVGVIVMLLAGCADDGQSGTCGDGHVDIGEECDPGRDKLCSPGCTPLVTDVTAHWSFETLSGDAKSPCLPGEPAVELDVMSAGFPGDDE